MSCFFFLFAEKGSGGISDRVSTCACFVSTEAEAVIGGDDEFGLGRNSKTGVVVISSGGLHVKFL